MTGYQQPHAPMQQLQPPKKGWFARSWWWFLPLVILGPFFFCCGTCGGFMYVGMQQMEKLPPYQDTLSAANSSAEVQAEIGTPVEAAGLFETASSGGRFDYAQSGVGETLYASVPVTGPNGSGIMHIEATSSGGSWTYTRREIVVNGSGVVIDLMPSTPGGIIVPDDHDDGVSDH
ncbi:MAG: cytochrome c oxidase assembly factor Coa1 family protein [Planctomycetota bacterium]